MKQQKHKTIVRVACLAIAVLMVLGLVASVLISIL